MIIKEKLKNMWNSLGPGLITGASDDDPSAVVTYATAGARFGTGMVWIMLYLLPIMIIIQEMSARIGMSSSCGLAGNLKRYYSKKLLISLSVLIIFANTFNIGANVYGMASALELIVPHSTYLLSWIIVAIILTLVILLPYRKIVVIFKWLSFSLFAYMIASFLVVDNWFHIVSQLFTPKISLTEDYLLIFVAVLGTTISPYLAFWQSSEEAEERKLELGNSKNLVCKYRIFDKKELSRVMLDTKIGMFFSNFIAFFVIALTGTLFFNAGLGNIETVEDIADALRPLAGDYAYYLFAIGIISAGLLTIPILAGSIAYVISEIFNWGGSLDKPFSKARGFYLVIVFSTVVGLAIPYTGISAIDALLMTAIINGAVAPFLIATIIHMANNPNIVGRNTNNKHSNIWGYSAFLLMVIVNLLVIATKFPTEKATAFISNFLIP